MGSNGCRDCKQCSDSGLNRLFRFFLSPTLWPIVGSILFIFLKKCPQCGHRMSWHQRRADGSFAD
jgi:hypothetical protein